MSVNSEPEKPLRKGGFADVPFIAKYVAAAIDEAFGDEPTLAAAEKQRYTPASLRALIAADPAYAMISMKDDGTPIGLMLSSPDHGVLLHSWGFVMPQCRNGAQAVGSMRAFLRYWDNNRFHKVLCYTRPQNAAARIVLARAGLKNTALLEKHFFGQDVLVYEVPLTKAMEGYAPPVTMNRIINLKLKLQALFS